MQFLARAEPLLGCDRQQVVPLATEAGLLDALNVRLPPALEPLASWTRTGKVELPDGDMRRQQWWSARLTQVKAAALLEAATGRGVPAGCRHPPVAGLGLCLSGANYSTLLKWHLGVPLLPLDCAGRPCPYAEGRWSLSATMPCHAGSRALGLGTLALNLSSARSLLKPGSRMTARWTSLEMADARRTSCCGRGMGGGISRWT